MPKSCQDMEDIIRILIDMLYAKNVEFDTITDTVRKAHYCIFCMQHYKGCDCDFSKVAISSDSECSNHSTSIDDDYTSSESEKSESGSEKSESGSESKSGSEKSESGSESGSESEESESESPRDKEDDIFINNIINKNMSPMNIKLDDPASSSEESGSEGDSESDE